MTAKISGTSRETLKNARDFAVMAYPDTIHAPSLSVSVFVFVALLACLRRASGVLPAR